MANNNNESMDSDLENSKDNKLDKSFVGKFVSGLISNTPLSKWFNTEGASKVRRREETDEDTLQPPIKRSKPSNHYNNIERSCINHRTQFPEPTPGPSGVFSRQLFTNRTAASAQNDDSESEEESTIEYCQEQHKGGDRNEECNEKETTINPTRSFFTPSAATGRSLFADKRPSPETAPNTSLSTRRPNFNASTFGAPSFIDRTLSTARILNSPFYTGRTTYGGASAYSRRPPSAAPHIQIKPNETKKSENNTATLSKTARRILSALEQYSTPVNEAKKIPVTLRKEGVLSKYVGAAPYMVKDRKRGTASNKELQVPELLQMKQRLQVSTENCRQMACRNDTNPIKSKEYALRSDDVILKKDSRKIRAVGSKRGVSRFEEVGEGVELPQVPLLPLTNLPKFDFVLKPQDNKVVPTVQRENEQKQSSYSDTNDSSTATTKFSELPTGKLGNFVFSRPLVISHEGGEIRPVNCFKFSEPWKSGRDLQAQHENKGRSKVARNNGETLIKQTEQNDIFNEKNKINIILSHTNDKLVTKCGEKTITDDSNDVTKTKVASTLQGFGDKFKASADQWECPTCMIRNKFASLKCVACETDKPGNRCTTVTNPLLPTQQNERKWECPTCLVMNDKSATQCAACEEKKPIEDATVAPPLQSFGHKFKATADQWECPTCMIRNKNTSPKCVACETSKPGEAKEGDVKLTFPPPASSFTFGVECTCSIDKLKCQKCNATNKSGGWGSTFKTKQGEWECSSCMVRNKNDAAACVCCGSSKPGVSTMDMSKIPSEPKKPIIAFNFGIDKANVTNPIETTEKPAQFSFGIPKPVTTEQINKISVTTGNNVGKTDATVINATPTTNNTFSFGINDKPKETTSTNDDKVGNTVNSFLKPSTTALVKPVNGEVVFDKGAGGGMFNVKTATPPMMFNTTSLTPVLSTSSAVETPTLPVPAQVNTIVSRATPDTIMPTFNFAPFSGTPPSSDNFFKFGSGTSPKRPAVDTGGAPQNGFAFGNEDPTKMAGGFSFNPAGKMFKFGAAASSGANLGEEKKGFQFSVTSVPSSGFSFGSGGVKKDEGTSNNGGFSFGGATSMMSPAVLTNNNDKGVFSFGQVGQPNPGLGKTPAQGGGFNFGTTSSVPGATFSFTGAPPSFGFTDGAATGAQPQRKFKKALRRSHR